MLCARQLSMLTATSIGYSITIHMPIATDSSNSETVFYTSEKGIISNIRGRIEETIS